MSIEVTHLRKTFGAYTALDDVSLSVKPGQLTALLGPSGSGKTTLLRIIAGLEFADPGSGAVCLDGQDVTALGPGERGIGFVFQHYALFRHLTVFENVAFGLSVRPRRERPSRAEVRDRVQRLLQLVQLDGLAQRLPTQLSGGQRQRVALARALAIEPKVLLLDEPFGALDAKVRKELRRWLRQFHEEVNLTTLFVTHDQEEALEIADEVVVMNNARIEQVGAPQTVYDQPASPFVIEFLGNVNRLAAGVSVGPRPAGADTLYVRPHDVDIRRGADAAGTHALPVKVLHIFAAGSTGRVVLRRLDTGEAFEAELSRGRLAELDLRAGEAAWVVFRHVRLFPDGRYTEADLRGSEIAVS
ncbi:sulfate/molybdate ABC transporter ATP-binding protein [Actomonas aquatica]|uniref:Sulfate ABC transporter ATP-binding protein n=1 Tax=Actomonas aquatica TaxID=2866162 RepID=A0ABZ1C766_9BACT|nr:sulfate ABC transporter ATP-binding protein [Opitutus sp. WL0086]WRQ87568.1 sulfate ABC transporter ATP-binding protein [Opitutus sp. WL0086]